MPYPKLTRGTPSWPESGREVSTREAGLDVCCPSCYCNPDGQSGLERGWMKLCASTQLSIVFVHCHLSKPVMCACLSCWLCAQAD